MSETPPGEFDQYAARYEEALAQGLSVSGESKDFFAQGRVVWLTECLRNFGISVGSVLDFGCGTGSSVPFFIEHLKPARILGVDVSAKSLEVAAQQGWPGSNFQTLARYEPRGNFDLAYCNGVFHHIPLAERARAVQCVADSLRPGGVFSFWENNPWNPGTRYVMSRIPFDREAITLSVVEARRLLRVGGFEVLRQDFHFIFPAALKWLRWMEPPLARLPLGAQYHLLCRKPA
jgi:SAM-dependent methyltransferase